MEFIPITELESQVRCLQDTGSIIRLTAPVVRLWPWENGVILHPGSLAELLHKELKNLLEDSNICEMIIVSTREIAFVRLSIYNGRNLRWPWTKKIAMDSFSMLIVLSFGNI